MQNDQKLRDCFRNSFGAAASDPSRVNFGAPGWDSIAHIALVTELETSFGIEMSPEEITELTSYSQAEAILRRHGVAFDGR